MSTISSGGSMAMTSPRDRLQQILDQSVSAGSVSQTDESALSAALDDIDSAMKAGASSGSGASRGSMKDKVNGMISDEVSSGKLTDDQATELKKLFAEAHHAMHHAGAAPPPPPAVSDDDSVLGVDATSSTGATTATSSTSGSTDTLASVDAALSKLLAFVKKLEAARSENSVYDSSGSAASAQVTQPLMVDTTA